MAQRTSSQNVTPGITTRHQLHCRSNSSDLRCNCKPSHRGEVWNPTTKRPLKSTWFKSVAEARAWRVTTLNALQNGRFASPQSISVTEASHEWLASVEAGRALNRSGLPYKPSAMRSYETSLRLHVLPLIGSKKLGALRRTDIQAMIDKVALSQSPSTVRNAINPLRALLHHAVAKGLIESSPADHLRTPAVRGLRDRIATPAEAQSLINVLPTQDQAIWATAFYSGLRLGELRALTLNCVDLDCNVIYVKKAWDTHAGVIEPKSKAGIRTVPIPAILVPYLEARSAPTASAFIFGIDATTPFKSESVRRRAHGIWKNAGMTKIGFHEARHTYASICIGAGIDAKALSTYMGHSSIATTYDIYGKLFPGNEQTNAAKIDRYVSGESSAQTTPFATPSGQEVTV